MNRKFTVFGDVDLLDAHGVRQARGRLHRPSLLLSGLLLPEEALACDGAWPTSLDGLIEWSLILALLMLLAWGVRFLWRRACNAPPQSRVFLVLSGIVALVLGWTGVYVVPEFGKLLSGFAELPGQTRIVLQFNYLLLAPAVPLPFLAYRLKANPWRERYFAALTIGECALTYFTIWALNSPIFKMC